MSIKRLCCFYCTAAAAFVFPASAHVYVLAYAGELSLRAIYLRSCKNGSSDLQRQSRAKTRACAMAFGECGDLGCPAADL